MSTNLQNMNTFDTAELFRQGLRHYKDGRLKQAQDICQRIVNRRPNADALLILGMIAHQQSEYEVAVERYQQFLRFKPDHAQTHYNLGLVLEKLGGTELAPETLTATLTKEAIDHYKKSIAVDADNAVVHGQLADAYNKLKRWEEAI